MEKWEKFAQKDAEYYILSHDNVDYSNEAGQEYFFNSGEQDTQRLFDHVNQLLSSRDRALDIGCGIGRLAFAHAKIFKEVCAVDISETMLKKLKKLALQKKVDNVRTYLSHETWDTNSYYDYIYSFIVFQHIIEFSIIEEYIRRISKAISTDGIIQLQFDTRNKTLFYKLRNIVPDIFLPKSQKRGIRRNRRNSEDLRRVFRQNKLEIVKEINPDSSEHFFIMRLSK